MHRKTAAFFLSVLLLMSLGRTAAAAEQTTGSIRITLKTVQGEVTLYHAGTASSGGYYLTEAFGGGFVKEEDIYSPALAQWLAETAQGGTCRLLDADGCAKFSRLEEGLYLLKQTGTASGEDTIAPLLIALPYYGEWDIESYPKTRTSGTESPRTAQGPEPFIGLAGMLLSGAGLLLCRKESRKKT